jgi:hypothetical protein
MEVGLSLREPERSSDQPAAGRWVEWGQLSQVLGIDRKEQPMSFALSMIGLAVLVGGIAWGLITAGLAATYVAIACLIVAGLGIMMAVSRTRAKDPPV